VFDTISHGAEPYFVSLHPRIIVGSTVVGAYSNIPVNQVHMRLSWITRHQTG